MMVIVMKESRNWIRSKRLAIIACAAMAAPMLAGCGSGGSNDQSNLPPVDNSVPSGPATTSQPQRHGMSTKQKLVLLAGAAALYYIYKKHKANQNAQVAGEPTGVQYYLSKNGRIYYRDANHRAHWVTPPSQGIQVPAGEAQAYSQYQGYDNSQTGKDLVGVGSDPSDNLGQ